MEVCTWETGYEGGGRKRRPCWIQEMTLEVLRTKLEESLCEGRQRYWDCGGAEEGRE